MNLLEPADWTFPVPIHFGPGRVRELAVLCQHHGIDHPLVVTDRGSAGLPFIDTITSTVERGGLKAGVFAGISPNPVDSEIEAGKRAFEDGGHDGVVAVGGGSGMDGGKAVSLIARRSEPLWAFDTEVAPVAAGDGFVPLICIPTTAGTGAESESTAMVTDTARGIKACVWHERQKPRATILDPELTVSLPRDLTVWTGIDALVHALEAYCVDTWHPLCDGAALEALKLIGRWLPTAVDEPENMTARAGLLVGSCLAGVAFLKGLGLVHAISHMVGARYDCHHGLTNAIALPAVLRFNEAAMAAKTGGLCAALGFEERSFTGLYGGITAMLDRYEIPVRLADIGVGDNTVADLARKAITDPAALTNPRQASLDEMAALIRQTIVHGR